MAIEIQSNLVFRTYQYCKGTFPSPARLSDRKDKLSGNLAYPSLARFYRLSNGLRRHSRSFLKRDPWTSKRFLDVALRSCSILGVVMDVQRWLQPSGEATSIICRPTFYPS